MPLPDIDSVDDYGGILQNARPVDDPTTQREATAVDAAFTSMAAATHTLPRAWVRITLGAVPANVVGSFDSVWGISPSSVPAHVGTGSYTVTLPATVNDEMGNPHVLNLRWVDFQLEGSTFGFAQGTVSANVVAMVTGNAAGSPNDLSGVVVLVRVG